ncbi:MAG TPA: HAMP domain-containing sensor histidine kinase [Clostridia bacterium]|nr:HAMP domain-containing sensor histidine kinase [Clostridia bacterium]
MRKYIVLSVFLLLLILAVTGIIELIFFNHTANSLSEISKKDYAAIRRDILGLRSLYIAELIIAISFLAFTCYLIAMMRRNFRSAIKEKETVIIEHQKAAENQHFLASKLSTLYNEALEYNKVKTEFFSNISHELKTPLSVILGAVQLMDQKTVIDDRRKPNKHLKTIRQNCYRLVRLTNNILDITRIDSGYIKMNLVNYNIVSLIEEITQSVAPYAEQKGLTLIFDTEEEEIISSVDIDKIERIILNLLSNAIKFTAPKGKVLVNIQKGDNTFSISVKDEGLGIPADMQNMIFERFRQCDNSLTRFSEGSGIGLSLVKSFVELHSGNIKLISEENKGSEFIIELPIRLCEESSATESLEQNYRSRIIETIKIEFSDIYSTAS